MYVTPTAPLLIVDREDLGLPISEFLLKRDATLRARSRPSIPRNAVQLGLPPTTSVPTSSRFRAA